MKKNYLTAALVLLGMSSVLAQHDTVNIDFGETLGLAPAPWNNITDYEVGSIADLIDVKGNPTGVSIAVTDSFSMDGAGGTSSHPNFPAEVSRDHFFGNTSVVWGMYQPTAGFTLNGLNPAKVYDFGFYCSRMPLSNRETKYVVNGTTSDSVTMSNTVAVAPMVWVKNMTPKSDGSIEIQLTSVENSTDNPAGYYYISAMSLVQSGTVGILENEMTFVSLFPNPSKGVVTVSLETGDVIQHIQVYNIGGVNVWETEGTGAATQTFDVSALANGVYILKASTSSGEYTTKFTIE